MGTVFEELVRRFNEENNEEAGEHWTPRDAVKLMARLIFLPIADGSSRAPTCSTTAPAARAACSRWPRRRCKQLAASTASRSPPTSTARRSTPRPTPSPRPTSCSRARATSRGQPRRRAGALHARQRRVPGARVRLHALEPALRQELEERPGAHGRQGGLKDPRFVIEHAGDPEYSLLTRSQRRPDAVPGEHALEDEGGTKLGSRIAEVHNGSSLFTGDAGQGESNIRRWIIENDWLEAIVALPLNMFYNTGIATYVWVLTNRKPAAPPAGKVQLIDATQWFKPLRKNLGQEELRAVRRDIERICDTFLDLRGDRAVEDLRQRAFGYWKVTVERPLRIRASTRARVLPKEIKELKERAWSTRRAPR
jgi:type I restriction enzyme M protein